MCDLNDDNQMLNYNLSSCRSSDLRNIKQKIEHWELHITGDLVYRYFILFILIVRLMTGESLSNRARIENLFTGHWY